MKQSASVIFIQSYGRDNLFTGVPPESMWGWQRNVGLLVALLNLKKITWKERYAKHLSEVNESAELFILRDWRYSQKEVYQFRMCHPNTPVISMVFNGPQYYVNAQRIGEERALLGISQPETNENLNHSEDGLFVADCVIVRSKLNEVLFAQLGRSKEEMVLLPHAPVWTLRNNCILPAELPCSGNALVKQRNNQFNLLFVGENFIRKGLFRLYKAFSSLSIPGKRLHIYNRTLYKCATGVAMDLPAYVLTHVRQMVHNPSVYIHLPYRDIQGLVEAHTDIDLMVCPSLLDCGPNVVIEGYQLGTPILASTLCGAVSDLPKGSMRLVAAPQWWHQGEKADAFTERLIEEISQFYSKYHLDTQSRRPNVLPLIETIVGTWENLLSEYL